MCAGYIYWWRPKYRRVGGMFVLCWKDFWIFVDWACCNWASNSDAFNFGYEGGRRHRMGPSIFCACQALWRSPYLVGFFEVEDTGWVLPFSAPASLQKALPLTPMASESVPLLYGHLPVVGGPPSLPPVLSLAPLIPDRKSTRLNSSHAQ